MAARDGRARNIIDVDRLSGPLIVSSAFGQLFVKVLEGAHRLQRRASYCDSRSSGRGAGFAGRERMRSNVGRARKPDSFLSWPFIFARLLRNRGLSWGNTNPNHGTSFACGKKYCQRHRLAENRRISFAARTAAVGSQLAYAECKVLFPLRTCWPYESRSRVIFVLFIPLSRSACKSPQKEITIVHERRSFSGPQKARLHVSRRCVVI